MTDAITSVVIAIAIPLVFWWLARTYPAPELATDGPSLEELGPKYRKLELVLVVVYIVLWFPVSAALYAPLHFVAEWRAHLMQTDRPSCSTWMARLCGSPPFSWPCLFPACC